MKLLMWGRGSFMLQDGRLSGKNIALRMPLLHLGHHMTPVMALGDRYVEVVEFIFASFQGC